MIEKFQRFLDTRRLIKLAKYRGQSVSTEILREQWHYLTVMGLVSHHGSSRVVKQS